MFAHCPWGRENDPNHVDLGKCKSPWENQGLIQCEVKYADDAPLHMDLNGAPPLDAEDAAKTRSTLLTKICIRRSDTNGENIWEYTTFVEEGKICGEWGIVSGLRTPEWNHFPFNAKCSLSGPSVVGIVPTVAQLENMYNGLLSAFSSKSIKSHEVVRVGFHDAASYSPDVTAILGGARGCMKYEHIHGAAPNIGLAFVMEDSLWNAIGCIPGVGKGQNGPGCWSMTDVLQYASMVAVEVAQGPIFSDQMLWGRPDAPRMFCFRLPCLMPMVDKRKGP